MQNNNYQHYSDDIYSQTIFNFARLNICTASYQYSGREPYMHGHRDHIDKEMFLSTQGEYNGCKLCILYQAPFCNTFCAHTLGGAMQLRNTLLSLLWKHTML